MNRVIESIKTKLMAKGYVQTTLEDPDTANVLNGIVSRDDMQVFVRGYQASDTIGEYSQFDGIYRSVAAPVGHRNFMVLAPWVELQMRKVRQREFENGLPRGKLGKGITVFDIVGIPPGEGYSGSETWSSGICKFSKFDEDGAPVDGNAVELEKTLLREVA